MLKLLRIFAGTALAILLLYAVTLAVRDCPTGPYAANNCLWLWVRARTGLPESRLWRAAALEVVGITLLAGLFITFRYVFPSRSRASNH